MLVVYISVSVFIAVVLFILIIRFLNKKYKPPILGIYQQRSKYFCIKYRLMLMLLKLKQFKESRKRRSARSTEHSDGKIKVIEEDVEFEGPQKLDPDSPLAVDAVYFNGTSQNGAAVLFNIARRHNRICDGFFFLKVEGEELLLSPKLPDSGLKQTESEANEFSAEGIKLTNVIPMRTWKLEYDGELKSRIDPEKRFKAKVSLTFAARFPQFNYNFISPISMARDVSTDTWTGEYFTMLQKFKQTHYEQMGVLEGTALIDGKTHKLTMPCVRDHSFARHRDWRNFHRYAYHFIHLENGDGIAIGCASQYSVLSHLTIGYYCSAKDQSVTAVDWCDFHLYQHGEGQLPPKDYAFTFTAGSKSYTAQILVNDEQTFYIGKDREAKFFERWCSVNVNGNKGWACAEWHYNNVNAKNGCMNFIFTLFIFINIIVKKCKEIIFRE